ncbi:MAG: biotin-dependent carboxyltransferase [Gammaproteobacteria bacterium]|nr:biotin-dependent carboxyltransferase [Gammaproteobacteria bacterium]MDE2346227.1 biotin-dependent carboxyltransferase [Gammaproteobacteria bacterium]
MITVVEPGRFTSFQDLGRSGYAHLGVPHAGAVDSLGMRQANLLVGNPQDAATLEMTLQGPTLHFGVDAVVAFSGGRLEPSLDGEPLPMHQSLQISAGQTLGCGKLLSGVRSYLAIAGGFSPPATLSSRSSDSFAGLGPPLLCAGDLIHCETRTLKCGWYLRSPAGFTHDAGVRVMAGPHDDWFEAQALQQLLDGSYEVRAESDRTGLRLKGARIAQRRGVELPSQGMVSGAIQIPGDGQPIVLLCNHGSTGGYPVIAVVIQADLPHLGQLRAGDRLRFAAVTRAQALAAYRHAESALQNSLVSADAGLLAARSLLVLAREHPSLRRAKLQLGRWHVAVRR